MSSKKELFDSFWKGLTVTIIFGIVLCCIVSIGYNNFFDISFIKDVFGSLVSIFAIYMAIHLFNDWKEQYNVNLEKDDLKIFKSELISLRENIDYYHVHFLEIYLILVDENHKKNNITSFSQIITDHHSNIKEVKDMRRKFSFISISYNQKIRHYLNITPEFNYHSEYDKINNLANEIDKLIEYFESDNLKYFYLSFEDYTRSYENSNKMLENQLKDLNKKIKV